jgi:TonB family protein
MKFRIAVLFSVLCITCVSAQVQAQSETIVGTSGEQSDPAKIAQIRRLLSVMGVQDRMPQMMRAMTDQMAALMDTSSSSGDTTQAQVGQFTRLLRERMISKMQALDLVGLYVPVYDRNYTADDIDALIVFYESPVGKKTLQLQTQLSVESMQAVTPAIQKLMKESMAEIRKEHPEFELGNDSRPASGGVQGGVIGGVQTAAPPPLPPNANGSQPTRITRGGEAVSASATYKAAPIYPELARQARVQGTVRLHTLIDTDGRVIEVKYVSGPAMLVQSAIDSVKQWQFKPTTLNSVPVQVECVLEINFNLRN